MRRVVRGFWGPRVESAEALAGRWKRTLDELGRLGPGGPAGGSGGGWAWRQVHSDGPATGIRAEEADLLTALRAAAASDDWSDGAGLRLFAEAGAAAGAGAGAGAKWEVEVSGRAGADSEFLLQSMVIGVEAPEGAEGAGFPYAGLLAAVAGIWEPDFGDVTDDDVLDVLEDEGGFVSGDPALGWAGYLSPARAALVPDGLDVVREELGGGGVLLTVAPEGGTGAVLRASLRLRETGALQPLPRPMTRAVL
ncbi:hypothetical protein AB0O07_32350 [Streptomyces sp. NPDC093085]|uniref:hypothetical protein n=1 Tax=Streptomyces sp. NPDC093085 TaxID=3155068 RepID=UPI00343D6AB8